MKLISILHKEEIRLKRFVLKNNQYWYSTAPLLQSSFSNEEGEEYRVLKTMQFTKSIELSVCLWNDKENYKILTKY